MSTYKLLIDGKLVDGASSLDVINPATGKLLETAPKADEAQVHRAVAAAKRAFPRWSALRFEEREADADVTTIAPQLFASAMSNAGQICTATKRVYAHSSLYERLCDELARLAREAVVGDGLEQGVTIGPLQNKMQFEKIRDFIEDAKANGKVIAGGEVSDEGGYFISPTIVKDIPDAARLVREEQFGPVLPVLKYDDLADAIARATDSEYGLAGSVWTSNVERGFEVATQIDSGTVWVNEFLEVPFDVPFRGAKQSGLGGENGEEAIQSYTQAKIINVALAAGA